MDRSPYRTMAATQEAAAPRRPPMGNCDLVPVFAAIWLAGVIRVGMALVHHETFGTELTLVFLTVALIPVLLFSSRSTHRS